MKCLVVLTIALVAFVAANDEDHPKALRRNFKRPNIQNDCSEKSGISQEHYRIIRQKEHTDDKAAHEYVMCTLKKGNFFTEENGFNVDVVLAEFMNSHLDEEVARELTAKCLDRNEQGSTPADWAYRGVRCLDENKIEELLRAARRKFNGNNNENKV